MPDAPHISHARHAKCSSGSLDRSVGDLAERQHGLVSRQQLLAAGMGRGAIADRVKRGLLRRVRRGVYSVGHTKLDQKARWMAAVLAAGPGAVLSHRSAAALWGVLPVYAIAPEVTCPTRIRSGSGSRVHQSPLALDEVATVDAIPVTSTSRTLLDLAACVKGQQLEQAFNEVEVRGLTDRCSVPELLARHPRRAGSRRVKVMFAADARSRGVTREELERRFAELLAATDLPHPRRNAPIAIAGRHFEADCLWAQQRLILELDGRATHGTALAFEEDRERDRLLLADGWRVMRVTWRQLHRDPNAVLADLRRALRLDSGSPTL